MPPKNKRPFRISPERNPVLGSLPPKATTGLLAGARMEKLVAGSYLMREGSRPDAVYFVLAGQLSILKGEKEIDRQGAGGILGEMGVLTEHARNASVRCLSEVEVLRVEAKTLLSVVDQHPEVLRALIRDLVGKVQVSHQVRVDQMTAIQKARETLLRCLSEGVVDQILEKNTPEQLLAGQLNETAILFYDIAGFSAAAEKMNPKRLLHALNEHLEVIVDSVEAHQGTVVNFIGDAVLAVFNCPVAVENAATSALQCYLTARENIRHLQRQRSRRKQFCFDLGAGINYGTVVSGAIGSESRFSFSVLGDEVNLAARLEGLTRHYPVELILSEALFRKLPGELAARCVLFDRVQVRGRQQPVRLFTVPEHPDDGSEQFSHAVEFYLKGDFESAKKVFSKLQGPLAGYLGGRCYQDRKSVV